MLTADEDRGDCASGYSYPVIVSVVLPCLNEEASVGDCVSQALDALASADMLSEVLVVDNGSQDASAEIARRHGARVVTEPTRGYGAALKAGIREALGEIVVMADADLTYELATIPRMVAPILEDQADLVIGGRLESTTRESMPFLHRRVGTPLLTFLVRRAAGGASFADSQSGFRAFRRRDISELSLQSDGMEFASEMLIQAARAGLRTMELPTVYSKRVGESKLNTFRDGMRHLRQILFLAPQLCLTGPGIALLVVGSVIELWGLLDPAGSAIGSLRWQPVFASGIGLVLGVQLLLAGLAVRDQMGANSTSAPSRHWTLLAGLATFGGGAGLDGYLFVRWLTHSSVLAIQQSLAALGSTAIIDGISLIGFHLLYPVVARSRRAVPVRLDPQTNPVVSQFASDSKISAELSPAQPS